MTNNRPIDELSGPLKVAVSTVLSEPVPADTINAALSKARELARGTSLANRKPPAKHVWSRRVLCVSSAAAAFSMVLAFWPRDQVTWADVLESLEKKPWIHLSSSDGATWYSPKHQLIAGKTDDKMIVFDLEEQQVDSFARTTPWGLAETPGKIFRSAITDDNRHGIDRSHAFFEALLRGDLNGAAGNELEIVSHERQYVNRNGAKLVEHRFTTRNETSATRSMTTLLVDAETSLPIELTHDDDGAGSPQAISYPTKGPLSIYDLGVPSTAEIVDLRPSDNVQRVLDRVRHNRIAMDSFHAIVVESSHAEPTAHALMIHRVWKAQNKWRIEQGRIKDPEWNTKTLANVSESWHNHLDQAGTSLKAISDGQRECTFKPITGSKPDPRNPNFLLIEGYKKETMPFHGSKNPGTQHPMILPDFVGYPGLWESSYEVEQNPVDGPPNTIRLDAPARKRQTRYFLDPSRGYLLVRTEYLERFGQKYAVSQSTDTLSAIQSPSGNWLPTLVRSNSGSIAVPKKVLATVPQELVANGRLKASAQYTHFFYRFDVPPTDEMFKIESDSNDK